MSEFKIIPNEQTPNIAPMGDINEFIETHGEVLDEFMQFASMQPTGVGLAANQTSLNGDRFMHRVFALKNLDDESWSLVIDPVIDEYVGAPELKLEGCLTWKGKTIVAERNRVVKVSYYDIEGNYIESESHKDFEGQIWQHEINHLNGIEERIEDEYFVLDKPKVVDVRTEPKIGRNEPCPCGSGKKHKKCCI